MLALTRRLVTLRAAHPALRCGDNAHWVVEGDLLAFDRIAGGETIRCLFNLGGSTIDLAARGDGGIPLVALNGADPALLPPCGALWLQMEGRMISMFRPALPALLTPLALFAATPALAQAIGRAHV